MCSQAASSGVSRGDDLPARAAGFLCENVRSRHHHEQAAAEEPNEVAAIELEEITPRLGQFVAFRLDVELFDAHRPAPVLVLVRIRSAARRTAFTIRGYVPQRQTLPSSRRATSCSDGFGFVRSRPTVAITMPDVQYPHWNASASRNAC